MNNSDLTINKGSHNPKLCFGHQQALFNSQNLVRSKGNIPLWAPPAEVVQLGPGEQCLGVFPSLHHRVFDFEI